MNRPLSMLPTPARAPSAGAAAVLSLSFLACVLGWLDPNHYEPWTAFHAQAWTALGAAVFAVWVAAQDCSHGTRYCLPFGSVALLAGAAVPWLQWWGGIIYFRGDAWIVAIYLVGAALAIATGCAFSQRFGLSRLVDTVAALFLAAGLISSWLSLYQVLDLEYLWQFAVPLRPDGRVVGNLSQPNQLAILMVMACASVGWFWYSRRIFAVTGSLCITLLFVPLTLSGSRAGALALFIVAVWLASAAWRGTLSLGKRMTVLAFGAAVTGACLALALASFAADLGGNATASRSLDSVATAGMRPVHWMSMLDASMRRPLTGYGWNQAIIAQLDVAVDHQTTYEMIASAHNIALDLMVAMGALPGLAVFVVLVSWMGWLFWHTRSADGVFTVALLLPVCMYSLVEFPQELTYFLLPSALLLGGLSLQVAPTSVVRVHGGLGLFAALTIAALTGWTVYDYTKMESKLRNFRFQQARIGSDAQRQPADTIQLLTQLDAFVTLAPRPDVDGMSREDLELIAQISKRYPNWTVLSRWAAMLARNGDPAGASAVLARICKTHPATVCERAKRQWVWRGTQTPAIAAVPWPE
jgi:Virulence factor membrane-bound polymerase, C-terminal/O-Antigen ligase